MVVENTDRPGDVEMNSEGNTVKFWAEIAKVQTMADGGLRVYFDLPEGAVEQAAILMQYKRLGVVADVTVIPRQDDERENQRKSREIKL